MALATVCIFNYNNAAFIAEALESVVSQKTDFEVEILVGDDASTDNSRDVVQGLQAKYPGRIQLLESGMNLGGTKNWLRTIEAATADFIFTLDADDYFTTEDKIQSQVDALRSDPSLSMAFHAVIEERSLLGVESETVDFDRRRHTLRDFFESGWYMRTSSVCFRSKCLSFPFPDWVHSYPYRIDSVIHVMLLMQGDAYYDERAMAIWRRHPESMSVKIGADNILRTYFENKSFAWQLHQYSKANFNRELATRLRREATSALVKALGQDLSIVRRREVYRMLFECDRSYLLERLFGKAKRLFST